MDLSSIKNALADKFIFSEDIAEILEVGLKTNKNILLYGPGGHGKSEMVETALKAINADYFVKSFSQGTTVDDLYGGLDIPAFQEGNYKHVTENSFLYHEVAVFEELFDAPAAMLCSLKDTLTAKKYRQGHEQCESLCNCVIAITNVDPNEIASMGASYEALIERFPLRLKVEWNNYDEVSYKYLLDKVCGLNNENKLIAKLCANSNGSISPRTAVHIAQAVSVYIKDKSPRELIQALTKISKFFPELLIDQIELTNELDREEREKEEELTLDTAYGTFYKLVKGCNDTNDVTEKLKIVKELKQMLENLTDMSVSDKNYSRRNDLVTKINDHMQQTIQKTIELA